MASENLELNLLNICDNIQDPLFVLDGSGKIFFSNSAFDRLTNPIPEGREKNINNWLDSIRTETLLKKVKTSIQNLRVTRISIHQNSKWYNLSINPINTPNSECTKAVVLAYDYTENVEREMKLNSLAEELELSRDVIQDNAGELAKAYDQLEFSRQELERFSKKLEEQNKLLIESDEKQKELNAQKDKFVSIISHDLRAPFTSILGYSDALLTAWDGVTEEEKLDFIDIINKAAKSQLELLDTLLHWSRFQTKKVTVRPEVINMAHFVDNCIMNLSGIAQKKGISLKHDISEDINIIGDHMLLSQVIQNIISNALKFTKEGGKIIVSLSGNPENEMLTFSITDTGVGIPEHIRLKLFRTDSKVARKGTSGEVGTGLGLLVCKEIIDLHNGEIWVESIEGKGTTFSFTIPKAYFRILIISGNDEEYKYFKNLLEENHGEFNTFHAHTLKEADELLLKPEYSLIICTQLNDKTESDAFFELINRNSIVKLIPTVITSVIKDQDTLETFLSNGADFVLPVSADKSQIMDALDKILFGLIHNQ
jgi:signal transduction histidine kinase